MAVKNGAIMGKELVVKTNKLNECMQNLELVEMRILALAICKFRQAAEFNEYEEPSASEVVRINASEYAELYGLSRYTAHEAILGAEKSLFQRQFTIINDKGNRVKSRWISHVEYIDGENAINIALSPIVVDNVTAYITHSQAITLSKLLAWKVAIHTDCLSCSNNGYLW